MLLIQVTDRIAIAKEEFHAILESDEDLTLKQQLELYVERVQDHELGLQKVTLESMRSSSSSVQPYRLTDDWCPLTHNGILWYVTRISDDIIICSSHVKATLALHMLLRSLVVFQDSICIFICTEET